MHAHRPLVFRHGRLRPRLCGFVVPSLIVSCFLAAPAGADPAFSFSPHAPGQHIEIRLQDLPAPYARLSPNEGAPDAERPEGALPRVPPGFNVSIFAEGLDRPREMAVAPNGDVFVSQTHRGEVIVLRDGDGDGKAETRALLAEGFRDPSGLAVQEGALYVADRRAVWRIALGDDPPRTASPRSMVTRPGALGAGGGHITRELVFSRDGKHFFVAIGSESNAGEDPVPRATIQKFRSDGHLQVTFASGLCNPVGLAFLPGTDDLYATVGERYGLGDDLVPDYFTKVMRGAFYGFPYAYLGAHPDPQFGELRPDLVKITAVPDVLFEAHSVPAGLAFYTGTAFPPDYRGDAFVALHGGWNAGRPAGYGVARLRFRDGRPAGGYEIFMTGLERGQGADGAPAIWGRPFWVAVSGDGALLVSDDKANVIWRIGWAGPVAAHEPDPAVTGLASAP